MTVGLVHYPTILAPVSGSVDVTTQCADNAHRTSSSMSVICTSMALGLARNHYVNVMKDIMKSLMRMVDYSVKVNDY